jgi:hypothetical protein
MIGITWFKIDKSTRTFKSIRKARTVKEAWEKSFAKWQLVLKGYDYDSATDACGLCNLYNKPSILGCPKCPIQQATGNRGCHGTPLDRIKFATKSTARKEIAFLRSIKDGTYKKVGK